jgi:osmotically-inducible protein OsmY
MTDEQLAREVKDELFWDPKTDSGSIAVAAANGVVTLRGTVGSLREKVEAKKAAERVRGVTAVKNHLEVQLLTEDRREDADLRGDVLQALMLDTLVPITVDARVDDGFVTLTGVVQWQYQRDEAELVAGKVPGVAEVINDILLEDSTHVADDVDEKIRKAFVRNARLDAERLEVTTSNGTVRLRGKVRSWDEHDTAIAAAWSAPGVRHVDDGLIVTG